MSRFTDYIARKRHEYGDKFDPSKLAEQFKLYLHSGERITIEFCDSDGKCYETKRGTVGVTTGWRPSFMLMLRSNSIGSSHLLGKNDRIKRV
jgi:hypothetical protein